MVHVLSGDNPTQLYLEAIIEVIKDGKELAPRGKKVKELHPAVVQFTNPYNRVTFLKGRKINPFFQLAEGLWILLGRADVEFLTRYNKNMANFSDDGVYFNAPYGERLRNWGISAANNYIYNPIDQLYDVYRKLKADPDSRQAFAMIGNPRFDNADYTLNGGKDIACNREIFFKIRDNKLDITVTNRSNDVHWGLWGANLNQFTTIQEMVASWLGIEVGVYTQMTDSLHIYTEDYGAKITEEVLDAYGIKYKDVIEGKSMVIPKTTHFTFENEPRMAKLSPEQFNAMLASSERIVEELIHVDENIKNVDIANNTINVIDQAPDEFFKTTLLSMVAYRAHRLEVPEVMISALSIMPDSQYKLSELYWLYDKYKDNPEFVELFDHYSEEKKAYIKGE